MSRRERTRENAVQKRKKTRHRNGGGVLILVLLILLVLAGILFFVKDLFSLDIGLPEGLNLSFLRNSDSVVEQAEKLAQSYDYDGAITLLEADKKFDSDEMMQTKVAELESERTAMSDAINNTLDEASAKVGSFDYEGAISCLKSSPYYETSALLQDRASEYQKAIDNGTAVDAAAVEQADRLAAMYDYDGAIELLKGTDGYKDNPALVQKVAQYEEAKAACVEIWPEDVTHIFYHSLVVDPSKAFVPDSEGYAGWQQWMTTIYEFDKITQSMYDRGYVLVSLDDLYDTQVAEDGSRTITQTCVYLPEGKKAFVLSLDDLSYYHTYDNHGVASKVVLDDNGKITCEYIQDDGTTVYGDYDAVPRLNSFLEEHPDGCYRGARGTVALTGYDGILGYRTDGAYSEEHNTDSETYYADDLQQKWLSEHPDYDWEQECAQAKKVADAMKAEGWTFASHTWGHKAVGSITYDQLVADTERWMEYVSPLIGDTDKIIFAHGEDIALVSEYTSSDKFQYLKSQGFDVYCPVDSSQPYTTDVTDSFFHQGRRNLDGYRIYQDLVSGNPLASDLFDASEVIDPERPTPVPDL